MMSTTRSFRRLGTATAVLASVFAMTAGCSRGSSSADSSASGENQKVIGVSLYSQSQARWQFDAEALEAEAKRLGDKVIMTFANADPQKQTQDVQSLLAQDIDVLVIASADVKVGGSLVEQAKRQDVKTIAYDIGVQGGSPDWYIERKQSDVARLQVEAAKEFAPSGKYVVVKGDAGNTLAQASSPVYATLADDDAIDVVYNDWTSGYSPDKALQIAESQLTQHQDDISAFVVNNDGMGAAVARTLIDRDLDGKVFVSGLDAEPAALKLIASDAMTMSVWTPIDEMGREAARAAHALASGETPESDERTSNDVSEAIPTKHVEMTVVNKDNLCEFITTVAPEGWASVEKTFGAADACS